MTICWRPDLPTVSAALVGSSLYLVTKGGEQVRDVRSSIWRVDLRSVEAKLLTEEEHGHRRAQANAPRYVNGSLRSSRYQS